MGNTSFCPQCGWDVPVDEDGCCNICGATAIGEAVDALATLRARVRAGLAIAEYCENGPDEIMRTTGRKLRAALEGKGDG